MNLLHNLIQPLKSPFLADFRSQFVVYPSRVCLLLRLKNLQKNHRFFRLKQVLQEVQ